MLQRQWNEVKELNLQARFSMLAGEHPDASHMSTNLDRCLIVTTAESLAKVL